MSAAAWRGGRRARTTRAASTRAVSSSRNNASASSIAPWRFSTTAAHSSCSELRRAQAERSPSACACCCHRVCGSAGTVPPARSLSWCSNRSSHSISISDIFASSAEIRPRRSSRSAATAACLLSKDAAALKASVFSHLARQSAYISSHLSLKRPSCHAGAPSMSAASSSARRSSASPSSRASVSRSCLSIATRLSSSCTLAARSLADAVMTSSLRDASRSRSAWVAARCSSARRRMSERRRRSSRSASILNRSRSVISWRARALS
mmetsp:Transcript_54259/g.172237  ORF Transcript_54259/g.172237 Transcript_54259/m.172237 type:complete len:266 (-) Transcript_54259:1245-2042(-)